MLDQTQLLQVIECSHLSHFFVSRKRTTPRSLLALKCDLINGIIDFAVFRRYHTSLLRFVLSPVFPFACLVVNAIFQGFVNVYNYLKTFIMTRVLFAIFSTTDSFR